MKFSVVECGYDRRQVDAGLGELADRLARIAVRATAAAGSGPEAVLAVVRDEVGRLIALLSAPGAVPEDPAHRTRPPRTAAEQAVDLLTRARAELVAAEQEAARIRDRAYADALRARRDFEASLRARQLRAERAETILAGLTLPPAGPALDPSRPAVDPSCPAPAPDPSLAGPPPAVAAEFGLSPASAH